MTMEGDKNTNLKNNITFINVPITLDLISVLRSLIGKGAMFHPGGPGSIPRLGNKESMKKFLSTLFFN